MKQKYSILRMERHTYDLIHDLFILSISVFGLVFGLFIIVFNPEINDIAVSKTQLLGLVVLAYSAMIIRGRKRN